MMKKNVPEHISLELTVGQVAKRSGVAISTLHYYESEGLISSWRNPGNQRRYAREVLRRVAVIKVAQRSGISLSAIRNAMAALPGGRSPTVEDWQKMSAGWKADLNDRIMRLTRLRDQLDSCIGCGCLSLGVCPLRNPWDKLSKLGPGAQLLDPERDKRTGGGKTEIYPGQS
jgi:MerR family transcriptional regulator, redox-sensitive transcriptional activator SoxR